MVAVQESPVEFGEKREGTAYQPRPGAYAVIFDLDVVAVLQTRQGYFLPGGGLDRGESPESGLHREVREEIGYSIAILRPLGFAIENVFAAGEGYFSKQCYFFAARLVKKVSKPSEADHELIWLPLPVAIRRLTHQSQSWAASLIRKP